MKHSLQKLLSLITSAVLLLSMLSCGLVSTAAVTVDVTMAQNCDDLSGVVTSDGAIVTQNACVTPYGYGLAYDRGSSGAETYFSVPLTAGSADDAVLLLYVDATGQIASNPSYKFLPQKNNANVHPTTGAPYYTVDSTGTVTEAAFASSSQIAIAKDFQGWVIVPLSCVSGLTADMLTGLEMRTGTNYNSVLVIDSISYAKDLETAQAYAKAEVVKIGGDNHTWADATCVTPKTCSICKTTEGEATGVHAWVDGVCSTCGTNAFTVAQDCEDLSGVTFGGLATGEAVEKVTCMTPDGTGMKWLRGTAGGQAIVDIPMASGTANDTVFMFYADATSQKTDNVTYNFYPQINGTNKYPTNDAPYYLVDANGEVTEYAFSSYLIKIAKSFQGWVIVPISSVSGLTATQMTALELRTGTTYGNALIMDDFMYAVDLAVAEEYAVANAAQIADGFHSWEAATCTTPKTCSVCGATEGDVDSSAHSWVDATCTEPKTCSVCGATEGEALGHNYVNKTCSRCGQKLTIDTLYTVGYDFETANDSVYTQAVCVSPYGKAGLISSTAGVKTAFTSKGTADDEALVFWVSGKNLSAGATAYLQVFIYSTAILESDGSSLSSRPQRIRAGSYDCVSADGVKGTFSVTGAGNVNVPADFEGWYIVPFDSFTDHWKNSSSDAYPTTLVPGTMVNMTYQNGLGKVYFDQIGFTADASAFITFLEGEDSGAGHKWGSNTCATCGETLIVTVNDGSDASGITLSGTSTTQTVTSDGTQLKWFRGSDGAQSAFTISLTGGKSTDEAILFYVNAYDQIATAPGYTLYANMVNDSTNNHAGAGKPYYFIDETGTVTEKTFSSHNFSMTADTAGWIVIPMTSFNGGLTADNVSNLYFATGTTFSSVLYLDEFGFAADTDAAVAALAAAAAAPDRIGYIGTSINEAENALRFGFTLNASGITVDGYQRDISSATVTIGGKEYTLVDFGAIVSNNANATLTLEGVDGSRTKNIVGEKLFDLAEDGTAYFACGIKNIPAAYKDATIYACPYFIYNNGVENIVVYGEAQEQSINGHLAL